MFARHGALELLLRIFAEHAFLDSVPIVPGSSSAISGLRDNSVTDLSRIWAILGVAGDLGFWNCGGVEAIRVWSLRSRTMLLE